MICEEEFALSCLDIPLAPDYCYEPSSDLYDAVTYEILDSGSLWLKIVKLEKCERSDLSSILLFLRNLQLLSPLRILSDYHKLSTPPILNYISYGLLLPVAVSLSNTDLKICYPFAPLGSVYEYLKPHCVDGGLPESIVCAIFARAVRCLCSLHKRQWVHRAVCARHFILIPSNIDADQIDVALCGLGSLAPLRSVGNWTNRTDLPVLDFCWRGWHNQIQVTPSCGTHPVAWYSPEMLAQDFKGYGTPSDVYSLGLTLGEFFLGHAPFLGTVSPSLIYLKKMCNFDALSLVNFSGPTPSSELARVFEWCTNFYPERRPSTEELLADCWVQSGLNRPLMADELTAFR